MTRISLAMCMLAGLVLASASAPEVQAREPGAFRFAHGHHQQQCINCRPRTYGNPDLFANYYAHGTCGGIPAQLYQAPLPVPAYVGHTYYTYQPFMPHEMLYKHHRNYYRYYDNGRGMTRTSVKWW